MKLYSVTTKLDCGPPYGVVNVHWYHASREKPVAPYAKLLANYDPQADTVGYHKAGVNELFTEEEMQALCTYLRSQGEDPAITAYETPIAERVGPWGALGCGMGDDEIVPTPEDGYNLPFQVRGHFYWYANLKVGEFPAVGHVFLPREE